MVRDKNVSVSRDLAGVSLRANWKAMRKRKHHLPSRVRKDNHIFGIRSHNCVGKISLMQSDDSVEQF